MAEATKEKGTRVLKPVRFQLTEHANQDWTITVEEGTTIEDIVRPEFYANVAPQLRSYDRLRVRTDDGAWYVELLVLSCSRNWAKVKVLYKTELQAEDVTDNGPDLNGYEVKYRGPRYKHSVLRLSDKEVLKEDFQSRDEAIAWLTEYVKNL